MWKQIVLGASLLSPASATLLLNGDFETVDSRTGLVNNRRLNQLTPSRWDVYSSIPGWSTAAGRGIEVQASGVVVTAHSGSHYIELDSHVNSTLSGSTNSRMYQDVFLGPGGYVLSFWYRPRTNTVCDNLITATLDGTTVIAVANERTSTQNFWKEYTGTFSIDTAGSRRIAFEAGGTSNQLGGFLDTVTLSSEVPEPGPLMLIGVGLAAIGLFRRQQQAGS